MGDFFISPAELWKHIVLARPVRIVDVRRAQALTAGSRFLPGARWRDHLAANDWARELPDGQLIVLNCMHGHNVSQLATATLREAGYNARALAGGVDGWIEAGLPTVGQNSLVPVGSSASLWVTRLNPKIDRVACPWLVRRFIDPDATFLFVEPDWVLDIARELGGISFDTPGADIEHDGEFCSFDTLLRDFDLNDPALEKLAMAVRGADKDRTVIAPEAAGLLAVMLGNALIGNSDHDVIRLGFPVYDALYVRLALAAQETHGWEPMRT